MSQILKLGTAALAASVCACGLAASPNTWKVIPSASASHEIISKSADSFKLKLKRTDSEKRSGVTAVLQVGRSMPSQYVLRFRIRGLNGKEVIVTPLLSYRGGARGITKFGPKIIVHGTQWKTCRLPLDVSFGLGDALFEILQVKIVANIGKHSAGTEAGVEVGELTLGAAGEARPGEESLTVLLPPDPLPAKGRKEIAFFFDNDDLATVMRNRRQPRIPDSSPDEGFRAMLLKTADKLVCVANSPEKASAIVYASCTPNLPGTEKIPELVRSGVPLIVMGETADPAIAELLPVEIAPVRRKGLPARKKICFADKKHPVAKRGGLSSATFGIYRKLTLRPDAKVLVAFSDGSPAVVEGKCGAGRVIYSVFSPGVELVPGKTSYDAFFLRLLGFASGIELPEKDRPKEKLLPGSWRRGADFDNFGRFGLLVGDGLLTELIRDDLSVANGGSEYRFSLHSVPKRLLPEWKYRENVGSGTWTSRSWSLKWTKVGKIELETTFRLPAEWKNEKLIFSVEGGIDDLAEVFFNGKSIGKITRDVPEYWRAPHRHRIPDSLLKEVNTIRIVSDNLRGEGGFNTCPEILADRPVMPETLRVDRINWLGKGGTVFRNGVPSRRFDTSLAFPGVRWEIFEKEINLSFNGIAQYAVVPLKEGIRSFDLRRENFLPVETLAKPWILLYGGERPVLLVFQRRPGKIEIHRAGGQPDTLRLEASDGKNLGMIVPLWLFGRENVSAKLPLGKLLERAEFWGKRAFAYPVSCTEFFRIGKSRVEIRDEYEYKNTENDWKIAPKPFAPVPSLAWLTRGTLFEGDEVTEWPLATLFGPFAARDNSSEVRWSLPVPSVDTRVFPAVSGWNSAAERVNSLFESGYRWSAGGYTKYTHWTKRHPMGANYPECATLSFYAWIMGLNFTWNSPFLLNEKNRALLDERTVTRFMKPVECFQYKVASRWREEPFSRIAYAVYFSSFYRQTTKYSGRKVSGLNYGDQNEASMQVLALARKLADWEGQADLVRANWNFFRSAARFLMVSDDWGRLCSHCRESGEAASIDMLNCEYPAMLNYARLAEIAGDEDVRAQALYRAARRQVPVLARMRMRDYVVANKLAEAPESLEVSLGWTEEGAIFRRRGAEYKALELFDMSQGIEPELGEFYFKYATKELWEQYMKGFCASALEKGVGDYDLLCIAAEAGNLSKKQLSSVMTRLFENRKRDAHYRADWIGIKSVGFVCRTLCRLVDAPVLESARDVTLRNFVYDPETRKIEIDLLSGPSPELILKTVRGSRKIAVKPSSRQKIGLEL